MLPLSPATLMVGLAAARSRTLASASVRPAAPLECGAPATENFDADIVGMTDVPGRKMYYGRTTRMRSARRTGATRSSPPSHPDAHVAPSMAGTLGRPAACTSRISRMALLDTSKSGVHV